MSTAITTITFSISLCVALGVNTSSVGLEITTVDAYDRSYADHGSGALKDLSCFSWHGAREHSCESEWFTVGDIAEDGYPSNPPKSLLLVRAGASDPTALAKPTAMVMHWTTLGSGAAAAGFFTPVCPNHYSPLGSVAIFNTTVNVTHFPKLRCVADKYLIPLASTDLTEIWTSQGSKRYQENGSVWVPDPVSINGTTIQLPFIAGPPSSFHQTPSAMTLVSWVLTPGLQPKPVPQQCCSARACTATCCCCYAPVKVEQVHIALGANPSIMGVQWVTAEGPELNSNTTVMWGTDPNELSNTAAGAAFLFNADSDRPWWNHLANMTGLKPLTTYYYKVGDALNGFSRVFHFQSQGTQVTLSSPQYHVIFGDMGAGCAFTICKACTCNPICDAGTCAGNTSVGLVSEVRKAQMMLQVGDFGYNLDSNNGRTGDQFFRNIEQIAAHVPFMVSIGNHENGNTALAHYTERFRLMPSNSGNSITTIATGANCPAAPNNWYYSWDDGLVHYVAISTEVYFGVTAPGVNVASQFNWLSHDLNQANKNRKNVPWIVVHGHRSIYCSCDGDCDSSATIIRDGININGSLHYGLEDLFMDNGVDFFLNGHEHNYERNYPTYQNKTDQSNINPKAPIYIVTGAAGCNELHEPFTRSQPSRSAFRSNNFGYSRFIVHNASHVHWQQVIMDPGATDSGRQWFYTDKSDNVRGPCTNPDPNKADPDQCSDASPGDVIDDTWIVQSHHGPFSKASAPKRIPPFDPRMSKQYDHWRGRLLKDLPAAHINQTVEMIRQFRRHYGEGKWLRAELNELQAFAGEFDNNMSDTLRGEVVQFEDTSADGTSDGRGFRPAWRADRG